MDIFNYFSIKSTENFNKFLNKLSIKKTSVKKLISDLNKRKKRISLEKHLKIFQYWENLQCYFLPFFNFPNISINYWLFLKIENFFSFNVIWIGNQCDGKLLGRCRFFCVCLVDDENWWQTHLPFNGSRISGEPGKFIQNFKLLLH